MITRYFWFIFYILGMGVVTYLISEHVSVEFNVLSQLAMVLIISSISYMLAFMNSLKCNVVADNYKKLI